ncbi:MAG: hypothetical protein ACFE9L_21780 [Candidatus Hodarchaeota archaeon]
MTPNIPSNRLTNAFHRPVETGSFQARISVKLDVQKVEKDRKNTNITFNN